MLWQVLGVLGVISFAVWATAGLSTLCCNEDTGAEAEAAPTDEIAVHLGITSRIKRAKSKSKLHRVVDTVAPLAINGAAYRKERLEEAMNAQLSTRPGVAESDPQDCSRPHAAHTCT